MKICIMVLLACFFTAFTQAQDIKTTTILWEADRVTNKQTGANHTFHCSFKTSSGQVEWIQKKGELKTIYTIISSEGTWSDINQMGIMVYTLERNGNRFNITFARANGTVTVAIDFSTANKAEAVQEFQVTNVQVLN
jgi:hypothetical protein